MSQLKVNKKASSIMDERTHLDIGMDREIISKILLHICSSFEMECEFAEAIEDLTDGRIDGEDFNTWLECFNVENIR